MATKVFVSYSHDSEAHRLRVRELAERLRAGGVDAMLDQFVPGTPAEGWPLWMERQIEQAEFVLVVCTPVYLRRYRGEEAAGVGRGATWEAVLGRQELYEAQGSNRKFVPVLFDGGEADIPRVLRAYTHYRLPGGFDDLYRYLTGQPALVAPPLGQVRPMPPVNQGGTGHGGTGHGGTGAPPLGQVRPLPPANPGGAADTQPVDSNGWIAPAPPAANRAAPARRSPIVFLAANPADTGRLAIDEEARGIEEMLRRAEHRDAFTFRTRWAVRPDDLIQALLEDRPVIVHFSGHGVGAGGLALQGDGGRHTLVSTSALERLFRVLKDDIRVVVLNACYSEVQAEAIAGVIDCVIGMSDKIGDRAARTFAASFYRALGFGRSVQNALDQGLVAVDLAGLKATEIPRLHTRPGVDADSVRLVQPA